MLIAYVFYENLLFSLLLSPYVFFYVKDRRKEKQRKEKLKLTEKFKDGMMAVSFSLNVGYSIENSFKEAVIQLKLLYGEKSDIVRIFQTFVNRLNRNENLEDILEEWAINTGIEDVKYFAEVFRYAKRNGGDLISIINNTARTIKEKSEVLRQIEVIISGKKFEQRVMSFVPFGIVIYLKFTSGDFISLLFGNIMGVCIMSCCLCIYLFADYLAKRIIDIEV